MDQLGDGRLFFVFPYFVRTIRFEVFRFCQKVTVSLELVQASLEIINGSLSGSRDSFNILRREAFVSQPIVGQIYLLSADALQVMHITVKL